MTIQTIGTRAEWDAARADLLEREKEHTRLGDELARHRRNLPWVAVEKQYTLDAEDGPKTLADLFDGRSQLLIYHFMFGPSYEQACPTNSSIADAINGLVAHLQARDVTLMLVSGAPIEKLIDYRDRMGWDLNWASSHRSDFDLELGFSSTEEQTRAWVESAAVGRPAAGRPSQRAGQRHRPRRLPDRRLRLQRLRAARRDGLSDLLEQRPRRRVPDDLLRGPRPRTEGPRRGRGVPDVDPAPSRVQQGAEALQMIEARNRWLAARLELLEAGHGA